MGNSYSLNKFDGTQTNNETNDSRKMLLLNQNNNAGYREATQPNNTTHNELVTNNHVDRQLPPLPTTDGGPLTIENETNR